MKKFLVLLLILLFFVSASARLDPPYDPSVTENYDNTVEQIPERDKKDKKDDMVFYIIIVVLIVTNILLLVYIKFSDRYITVVHDSLYPYPKD